jgi:lysophospholipase L1-like esterase
VKNTTQRVIFIYILLIHLLLGAVLIKSDFIERVQKKFGDKASKENEVGPTYYSMVSYHERMDRNVPDGSVIFIGDSLIQGLCVSAVACPAVNFGIEKDTTVGVLKRLQRYECLKRAAVIIIAIGLNDLWYRGNSEIIQNYSKIMKKLPDTIPVIFSAVLPVDEDARSYLLGWNSRIRDLNSELQVMCMKTPNYLYIDAGKALSNNQGFLDKRYHNGDGIHLNSDGNRVWIEELKKGVKATIILRS